MGVLTRIWRRLGCLAGRHDWGGCVCQVCGKERHQWKWIVDQRDIYGAVGNFMDEMHYYHQRCQRCGERKR